MIKYFRCKTGFDLETSINYWLENHHISIINIVYAISTEDEETWHNAIISYQSI